MKLIDVRRIAVVALAAAVLTLTACRDSSSANAGEGGASASRTKTKTPGPPADYVRSRCVLCSCRMFMGDSGECSRPSCGHSWKDHQRPPQGK